MQEKNSSFKQQLDAEQSIYYEHNHKPNETNDRMQLYPC